MTNSNELCPICGEGFLSEQVGENEVCYKKITRKIPLHYSVCDCCGMEQGDHTQTLKNKRAMLQFKKDVDGLLSGAEIRKLRIQWGISQADLAKVLGGGPVAFSKYEKGDVAQSTAMDKLIRVCRRFPSVFDWLAQKESVEYNRSNFFKVVLKPLQSDQNVVNRQFHSTASTSQRYDAITVTFNSQSECANEHNAHEQNIEAA